MPFTAHYSGSKFDVHGVVLDHCGRISEFQIDAAVAVVIRFDVSTALTPQLSLLLPPSDFSYKTNCNDFTIITQMLPQNIIWCRTVGSKWFYKLINNNSIHFVQITHKTCNIINKSKLGRIGNGKSSVTFISCSNIYHIFVDLFKNIIKYNILL